MLRKQIVLLGNKLKAFSLRSKTFCFPGVALHCAALRCVALRCGAWRKLSCVERDKFCYQYDLTHPLLVLEANNHGKRPRPTKRNEKPNMKNDKYILHSTNLDPFYNGN